MNEVELAKKVLERAEKERKAAPYIQRATPAQEAAVLARYVLKAEKTLRKIAEFDVESAHGFIDEWTEADSFRDVVAIAHDFLAREPVTIPHTSPAGPQTVERVEPHEYVDGGFQLMGDCSVCGHAQESPLHEPVAQPTERTT